MLGLRLLKGTVLSFTLLEFILYLCAFYRNATKSAEKISTLEADIKKSEETLVQLANKRKEIENDAAQLLKGIKELSEKITENEEDYNSIKKSVNELTKKENALKSEKIEIDQRFKSVMKVLDEQKAEIHQWRAKVGND